MTLKSTRDKETFKLEESIHPYISVMKPVVRNSSAAYAQFIEGLYVYLMCNGLPNAGFIVVELLHYLLYEHFGSLTFSPTFIFFVRCLSHFYTS